MNNDLDNILFGLLFAILLFGITIFCSSCMDKTQEKYDREQWNNGYCYCGGEWEYQQMVGYRYSTTYIYKCNKCNDLFESYTYFKSNP